MENVIGLLHQYYHKGCNFRKVTQKEVAKIINKLNHRARERLNFKTPYENYHNKDTKLLEFCQLKS